MLFCSTNKASTKYLVSFQNVDVGYNVKLVYIIIDHQDQTFMTVMLYFCCAVYLKSWRIAFAGEEFTVSWSMYWIWIYKYATNNKVIWMS